MKLKTINEVLDALDLEQPTSPTKEATIQFSDSDVYASIYDKMSMLSEDTETELDVTYAQMDEDEATIEYDNGSVFIKLEANYNDDTYTMTIKEGD